MIVSPHQRFQEEQPAHAPRLSGEGLFSQAEAGLQPPVLQDPTLRQWR